MFSRLLKLYSKLNSNTPVEDFTTEVFASLLESDPIIQSNFISHILNLDEDQFEVETQKHFFLGDGSHAIIDIVLKNTKKIIFIENKVESSEGSNQLEKYSKILDSLNEYKEKHLAYCTKYYDPKEEKRHNFKQYRWLNIANLFEHSENKIAAEFYKFLNTHNMTRKNDLSTKDLFHLENFKETLGFLENFLERIKPSFSEIFGKPSSPDYSSQMRKHNRYSFYKGNVFGSGTWNEIGVGFKFDTEPQAYIWIWTSASNSKSTEFNKYLLQLGDIFDDYEKDYCSFSIDLKSFLGRDDSMQELEKWYQDKFINLKNFADKTSDLMWKLESPPSP